MKSEIGVSRPPVSDTSVEIQLELHFKSPKNLVWILLAKIEFHVFFLLSRLSKINQDTIWICQKLFALAVHWVRTVEY